MDVAPNVAIFGNADTFFQGLVREGERGVQSHHGCNLTIAFADFLDEAFIFGNPAANDIAVGDFVAERGAQAGLADSGLDQVERAIPHGWGGMVINDGGRAVADAVNQRELGREQDILFAQRPVNFPPQLFEDFDEIFRRFSWNGHAACHG